MVVDRSACRQRWAESRSVRCNFSITAAARQPSKVTRYTAFYGSGVLCQVDSDALSLSAAGRLQPICRSDFMEAARVRCQRGGKQHGDDLSVRVHGQLALLLAFLYYGRGNPT